MDDEDGSDLFHDFLAFHPFSPNLPNDPTKLETELRGEGRPRQQL